jgi:flagellar protein FlbD
LIELTRLNGKKFTLNSELIETVEETPDSVITLTNGKKIIVTDKAKEIVNKVIFYKSQICNGMVGMERS